MPDFRIVAIVGVGLLGSSVGLALRERKLAQRVIGVGRREASLDVAKRRGAVTEITTNLAAGVAEADLVIVCTPIDQVVPLALAVADQCRPTSLITDVGSTKLQIVRQLDQRLNTKPGIKPRFIGSHPLAGSEKSGPEYARAELFVGRVCVLTPTRHSPAIDCDRLDQFWRNLGARVIRMTPRAHDAALAVTSHLPHLVASALAASTPERLLELVAGGWLDSTRIAAGEVDLWQQIFADNHGHVLKALDNFEKVLSSFRQALKNQDEAALRRLLEAGKEKRDSLGN